MILGKLAGKKLSLSSFDTQTFSLVDDTSVALGENTSLEEFRGRVLHLIKPFVQYGGLLDRRSSLEDRGRETSRPIPLSLLFFLSGTIWAFALISCRRLIVPRLRGIDRISHTTIVPVVQTWVVVLLAKFFAVSMALLPLMLLAKGISAGLSLDPLITWGFLTPAFVILGSRFYSLWIKSLNEYLKTQRGAAPGGPLITGAKQIFRNYMGRPSIDLNEPLSSLMWHKRRPFLNAMIAILIFGTIVNLVQKSVRYHSIYSTRMQEMKRKYEEQKHIEQEKSHAAR